MKKVLYGVLSIFIVAVIAFVSCFFALPNFNGWVKDKIFSGTAIEQSDEDVDGSVVIGNGESEGLMLMRTFIEPEEYADYGIDTQAENATLITATFTPAATTDKRVTWTVSGGNGKVTVTPVSGNPLQATVTVTGRFNTGATVTCTSWANSAVKATATVDYVKTIAGGYGYFNLDSIRFDSDLSDIITFYDGSVMPTELKGDVYILMDTDLYNYLSPKWGNDIIKLAHFTDRDEYFDSNCYGFACFFKDLHTINTDEVYADIAAYYYGQSDVVIAYLSYENVHTYYNGIEVDFFEDLVIEVPLIIKSFSDVTVNPNDIDLDNTTIIVGPNGIL